MLERAIGDPGGIARPDQLAALVGHEDGLE
jgi:hypothetical protein